MTEKRFTAQPETVSYKDNLTGEIYRPKYEMGFYKLLDKLNGLAEENQDNKAMIEFLDTENTQIMNELKTRTQIQHQLEKENEQLKKESYGNLDGLNYYQEQNGHLSSRISDLECENEQLKEEIKGFESCSHNWSILYNEAKNKVKELSKENKTLKSWIQCKKDTW